MTLQDAQALTSPFVRCRDGRIGTISRIRAGYALTDASQDAVGVQVRGEPALRWIPVQCPQTGQGWRVSGSRRRAPIMLHRYTDEAAPMCSLCLGPSREGQRAE